jgi:hypothetical protein
MKLLLTGGSSSQVRAKTHSRQGKKITSAAGRRTRLGGRFSSAENGAAAGSGVTPLTAAGGE